MSGIGPDAIVLLDGNNERDSPEIDGVRLRRGADLNAAVESLSRDFERRLGIVARLAREHGVETYVLTVPNNIRDWAPEDANPATVEEIVADASADRPSNSRSSSYWIQRGRWHEEQRQYARARECYLRAKDLDLVFLRTRSPWNESIRRMRSPYIRVVDMERILFGYAPHGIPGYSLFHDYCHMTLAANRIVAFETVKRMSADRGWPAPALADVGLELFTAEQLRRLYWIKAFKWTRSAWFRASGRAERVNAEAASLAYKKEADEISDQLAAFTADRKPPL